MMVKYAANLARYVPPALGECPSMGAPAGRAHQLMHAAAVWARWVDHVPLRRGQVDSMRDQRGNRAGINHKRPHKGGRLWEKRSGIVSNAVQTQPWGDQHAFLPSFMEHHPRAVPSAQRSQQRTGTLDGDPTADQRPSSHRHAGPPSPRPGGARHRPARPEDCAGCAVGPCQSRAAPSSAPPRG